MSSKREGLWPIAGKAQPSSVVKSGTFPALGHQVQRGQVGCEMGPSEEATGGRLAKSPWPQQNGGCEGH